MGLRVPIFFGEISINGSVPAGGGGTNPQPPIINCNGALNITDWIDIDGDWKLEADGELVRPDATSVDDIIAYLTEAGFEVTIENVPPVISCEGSDNYTEVHFFRKIGIEDGVPPTVKIDGSVIENPPEWLSVSEVATVLPPLGFENNGSVKYTNTDALNHTIEMDQQNDNFKLILINPSNTVVEFEEYKHYGVCLAASENPENLPYVGIYAAMNDTGSIPLQEFYITRNGVDIGQQVPVELMPYVEPSNFPELPSDAVDGVFASQFQVWEGATPSYFFNDYPDEITYEIVTVPADQDTVKFAFYRNNEDIGRVVTLAANTTIDLTAKGTSYTTLHKDWSQMATVGGVYVLAVDMLKDGVNTSHNLSYTAANETLSSVMSELLNQLGFYKERPRDGSTEWNNFYEGFFINNDLIFGHDIAYPSSPTRNAVVINPLDRISATLSFKATASVPSGAVDMYDYVQNESAESIVTTQGLLYRGETLVGA